MYIYVMKCSIFYKVGFSKNPKNRLKTVKTHNPLDVKIFATLKTDNHLELEKELHNLFANKKSRGEWFELNEDDLLMLKIDYGFNFIIPINSIKNNELKNSHVLNEIKEIRIDNSKIDYLNNYFDELFCCKIADLKQLRKCSIKFHTSIIKESIDSLYGQDMNGQKAYDLLFKVCSNVLEVKENPSLYVAKIVKAIMYKHYNQILDADDLVFIENNYDTDINANATVKTLNTKKFYMNKYEFMNFVFDNLTLNTSF